MTTEQVFDTIVRQILDIVPELEAHTFNKTDQLKELGLDSLDRGEVVMASLEQLNLHIPITQTHGPTNIGELAELLHAKLHQ